MPYFEVVGGNEETQSFPGTNVIPNGARGFENRRDTISVFLRDTEAEDGTMRTVEYNYVGSDAVFLNQFKDSLSIEDPGSFNWCNKTSAGDCDPGFTPLGDGNLDWFGNYAATEVLRVAVGDLVPYHFLAGCDVGIPRCVINGQPAPNADPNDETAALAHIGVFNISGDMFNFESSEREGTAFGLGLTDGNFDPNDDDHQDFMVRISLTVPEPSLAVLLGPALAGLVLVRRRTNAAV
ncbi:MAG: hypothetical protein QNK05_11365 [Myxococcota bacterium]|nr:hypothetical protein [Myxococcota bacterium]